MVFLHEIDFQREISQFKCQVISISDIFQFQTRYFGIYNPPEIFTDSKISLLILKLIIIFCASEEDIYYFHWRVQEEH